jgi:hypothetical protein
VGRAAEPQDLSEPDWALVARELKREGVTLTLLWQEYRAAHPDGHGFTWFCDRFAAFRRRASPTFRKPAALRPLNGSASRVAYPVGFMVLKRDHGELHLILHPGHKAAAFNVFGLLRFCSLHLPLSLKGSLRCCETCVRQIGPACARCDRWQIVGERVHTGVSPCAW